VLVVSDGDVSRGPAVERVLRSHLRRGPVGDATVLASAGTDAVRGEAMHPYTARALAGAGVDPGGHAAHRVTERRLAMADLVLVASRAQGGPVLRIDAGARSRTFTVLEFARLAAGLNRTPDGARDLVAALAAVRAAVGPGVPGEEDLVDVAAGSYHDHEEIVRRVDVAGQGVARVLSAAMRVPVKDWA
jgi:protein-tyrosine phosphatase